MTVASRNARLVRWGVLGCSRQALSRAIPAIQSAANATVAAVASRDARKAEVTAIASNAHAWFSSYDALVEDPLVDAIYISLPNHLHATWSARAAMAGKHVLCEKPAALSGDEMDRIAAACRASGTLWMEGFSYRFHPQFAEVHRLVSGGMIGDLRVVRSSFSYQLESHHSPIKTSKDAGGGALADIGCYCVDVSCWLFHAGPARVCVERQQPNGHDVDFSAAAVLEFDGARTAVFDVAFDLPRRSRCELGGTAGTVEITEPFVSNAPSRLIVTVPPAPARTVDYVGIDPMRLQFEHFSRCVLDGESPHVSLEQSTFNATTLERLRGL